MPRKEMFLNLDSEEGEIVIPSRVDLSDPFIEEVPKRHVPENLLKKFQNPNLNHHQSNI